MSYFPSCRLSLNRLSGQLPARVAGRVTLFHAVVFVIALETSPPGPLSIAIYPLPMRPRQLPTEPSAVANLRAESYG